MGKTYPLGVTLFSALGFSDHYSAPLRPISKVFLARIMALTPFSIFGL